MKKLFIIPFLLLLTACPVPDAARRLSTQLLAVQGQQAQAVSDDMATEDKFLDDLLLVANGATDSLTQQIQASITERTRLTLAADPTLTDAQKAKILGDMATAIAQDAGVNIAGKIRIAELVQKRKDKHNEIRQNYAILLSAQKELDEYVQSKRVDELVFNRIMDRINSSITGISSAVKQVSDITAIIDSLLPKPAPVPKGTP